MVESQSGWGFPGSARKAHYFPAGEIISLCNRWMFTGHREPETGNPSPDDCATCAKKLAATKEEG